MCLCSQKNDHRCLFLPLLFRSDEQRHTFPMNFLTAPKFFNKFFGVNCNVLQIIDEAMKNHRFDAELEASFRFVMNRRIHRIDDEEAGFYFYANERVGYIGSTGLHLNTRARAYTGEVKELYENPNTFFTIWGVCSARIGANIRSKLETLLVRKLNNEWGVNILNKRIK